MSETTTTPRRIISKHRPDEDYHEWWMSGETRWLDSLGRVNHGGGYHRWHVLRCNNDVCPAEAIVREDTITALLPLIVPLAGAVDDAALAARPAPVVSGAMADAAIEALGMNAYMTPERLAAHHAALGVVWTDPRTVADEGRAEA